MSVLKSLIFCFVFIFCHTLLAANRTLVLSYSGVTQGNGYNWAATMAFVSESLEKIANEAEHIQNKENRDVKIHLAGFAGGSSGSAITMLFDSLTSNSELLSPSSIQSQVVSIEEARTLAKTFRYIAKGTDFKLGFSASTFLRVFSEQVKSVIIKSLTMIPGIRNYFNHGVPKLWIHQMDGRVSLSDFGRMIYFARTFKSNILNNKLADQSGYTNWQKRFSKYPQASIAFNKMIWLSDDLDIYDANLDKDLTRLVNDFRSWQESAIKETMQTDIRSRIGLWGDLTRRLHSAMTPANESQPLDIAELSPQRKLGLEGFKHVLGEAMKPGYFCIALARPVDNWSQFITDVRKSGRIDYKELRPYVLMTQESADLILNSPVYQEKIRLNDPFISRYIIAVVDQKWAALNISTREPQLLNELIGEFSADHIRVRALYDPQQDASHAFKSKSVDNGLKTNGLAVIGGFPYQPMTAMLPAIYNQALRERLRQAHPETEIRPMHFAFQKDQAIDDPKQFPIEIISNKLNKARTLENAKANISDFVKWSQAGQTFVDSVVRSENGTSTTLKSNWSIRSLPAQLAGYGELLYAKTLNDIRLQMGVQNQCLSVYSPR